MAGCLPGNLDGEHRPVHEKHLGTDNWGRGLSGQQNRGAQILRRRRFYRFRS